MDVVCAYFYLCQKKKTAILKLPPRAVLFGSQVMNTRGKKLFDQKKLGKHDVLQEAKKQHEKQ